MLKIGRTEKQKEQGNVKNSNQKILKLILLFVLNVLFCEICLCSPTFVNSYPFEDLWPPIFEYSQSDGCENVIPAIGGGYLLEAFLSPGIDFYMEPQVMFFKISEDGELEWRKQDYDQFEGIRISSMASNGVDRYYASQSAGTYTSCEDEILVLDEECNIIESFSYGFFYPYDLKIKAITLTDAGILCAGEMIDFESPGVGGCLLMMGYDGEIQWYITTDQWGYGDIDGFYALSMINDEEFVACGYVYDCYDRYGIIAKCNIYGDSLWVKHDEDHQYIGVNAQNGVISVMDKFEQNPTLAMIALHQYDYSGYPITSNVIVEGGAGLQNKKGYLAGMENGELIMFYGSMDYEVHKISSNGELEWSNSYINLDEYDQLGREYNKGCIAPNGDIVYCATIDRQGYLPKLQLIRINPDGSTKVNEIPVVNKSTSVSVYPNPFNPTTTISYSIPAAAAVELSIYNVKGQKVVTLVNQHQEAGEYSAQWNGTDEQNNSVASGVYFYQLSDDSGRSSVQKCLLLK
jgi:hypothetical protein